MSIFEAFVRFQAVPERSVQADMRCPYESRRYQKSAVARYANYEKENGNAIGMANVVKMRSNHVVEEIAEHEYVDAQ